MSTTHDPMSVDIKAPVLAHHEIDVRAALATVWARQVDVNRWPTWQADVTTTCLHGPLTVGSDFTWTTTGFTIISTVYQLFEPIRILWGSAGEGATVSLHEWLFQPSAIGVHVTTNKSLSGPRVEADPSGIQKLLDASLQSWLADLKRTAEETDPTPRARRRLAKPTRR